MDWEAAGAIGEIVGAAAVVVTLLYLARETRKNAQALDGTSSREFGFRLGEWHRLMATDPELRRIVLKSVQPSLADYTEDEWWEFRAAAISLFLIYHTHYVQLGLEIGHREEQENYLRVTRGVIDSWPAWSRFWAEEAHSGTFTQGFIDAVNAVGGAPDFGYVYTAKTASSGDS
jgi:hypothetical protein